MTIFEQIINAELKIPVDLDDDESDAVGESGSAATGGSAGKCSEAGAKSPSKRSGGSEDENDEAGAQSPSKRAGDSEGDRSEAGAKSPSKFSGGSEDEHDEAGTQSSSESEKVDNPLQAVQCGQNRRCHQYQGTVSKASWYALLQCSGFGFID